MGGRVEEGGGGSIFSLALVILLFIVGFGGIGIWIYSEIPDKGDKWPERNIQMLVNFHRQYPTWVDSSADSETDTVYFYFEDGSLMWAGVISEYRQIIREHTPYDEDVVGYAPIEIPEQGESVLP